MPSPPKNQRPHRRVRCHQRVNNKELFCFSFDKNKNDEHEQLEGISFIFLSRHVAPGLRLVLMVFWIFFCHYSYHLFTRRFRQNCFGHWRCNYNDPDDSWGGKYSKNWNESMLPVRCATIIQTCQVAKKSFRLVLQCCKNSFPWAAILDASCLSNKPQTPQ